MQNRNMAWMVVAWVIKVGAWLIHSLMFIMLVLEQK